MHACPYISVQSHTVRHTYHPRPLWIDLQVLQVLQVLRPALGVLLGSSFLFTAYAAAKSS